MRNEGIVLKEGIFDGFWIHPCREAQCVRLAMFLFPSIKLYLSHRNLHTLVS